jgi:hypothetical protein
VEKDNETWDETYSTVMEGSKTQSPRPRIFVIRNSANVMFNKAIPKHNHTSTARCGYFQSCYCKSLFFIFRYYVSRVCL